jgi:glycosyltransferase involved in cell wall biosynthesis
MKTLLVISAGWGRLKSEEYRKLEQEDKSPRVTLFETVLNCDLIGDNFPREVPAWRRFLYRLIPHKYAQVLEAFRLRNRYDAIISWAEHLTLPLATLLKISRSKTPHITIFSWIKKKKKAIVLRRVHSHIDRMCIQSTVQREFAVRELGIPERKIVPLDWTVDPKFWRPMDRELDMISSSGREMRDYGTFVRAVLGTGIRCHIAARFIPWKKDAWVDQVRALGELPEYITIGYDEHQLEVREYYARSRFIVLPLLPCEIEVGSTVLLEAMAMGKAVICSKVKGQRDIIHDGTTGIFVPEQDEKAMRDAIVYLWEHPDVAEEMGRQARKLVERDYGLDEWVDRIRKVVEEEIERKGSLEETRI